MRPYRRQAAVIWCVGSLAMFLGIALWRIGLLVSPAAMFLAMYFAATAVVAAWRWMSRDVYHWRDVARDQMHKVDIGYEVSTDAVRSVEEIESAAKQAAERVDKK